MTRTAARRTRTPLRSFHRAYFAGTDASMRTLFAIFTYICIALMYYEPAMEIGANQSRVTAKYYFAVGGVFGLIQAISTIIGVGIAFLISLLFSAETEALIAPYLASAVLLLMGVYTFYIGLKSRSIEEHREDGIPLHKYLEIAKVYAPRVIIVCIGVFYAYQNHWEELIYIVALSIICAMIGLRYGYMNGFRHRRIPYLVSGAVLSIMAFFTSWY